MTPFFPWTPKFVPLKFELDHIRKNIYLGPSIWSRSNLSGTDLAFLRKKPSFFAVLYVEMSLRGDFFFLTNPFYPNLDEKAIATPRGTPFLHLNKDGSAKNAKTLSQKKKCKKSDLSEKKGQKTSFGRRNTFRTACGVIFFLNKLIFLKSSRKSNRHPSRYPLWGLKQGR